MQLNIAVWMCRSIMPGMSVQPAASITSAFAGVVTLSLAPTATMRSPLITMTGFSVTGPPLPSISLAPVTTTSLPLFSGAGHGGWGFHHSFLAAMLISLLEDIFSERRTLAAASHAVTRAAADLIVSPVSSLSL